MGFSSVSINGSDMASDAYYNMKDVYPDGAIASLEKEFDENVSCYNRWVLWRCLKQVECWGCVASNSDCAPPTSTLSLCGSKSNLLDTLSIFTQRFCEGGWNQ